MPSGSGGPRATATGQTSILGASPEPRHDDSSGVLDDMALRSRLPDRPRLRPRRGIASYLPTWSGLARPTVHTFPRGDEGDGAAVLVPGEAGFATTSTRKASMPLLQRGKRRTLYSPNTEGFPSQLGPNPRANRSTSTPSRVLSTLHFFDSRRTLCRWHPAFTPP